MLIVGWEEEGAPLTVNSDACAQNLVKIAPKAHNNTRNNNTWGHYRLEILHNVGFFYPVIRILLPVFLSSLLIANTNDLQSFSGYFTLQSNLFQTCIEIQARIIIYKWNQNDYWESINLQNLTSLLKRIKRIQEIFFEPKKPYIFWGVCRDYMTQIYFWIKLHYHTSFTCFLIWLAIWFNQIW